MIRRLFHPERIAEWKNAFDQVFQQRQNQPARLAPRKQARYYLTLPWVAQ